MNCQTCGYALWNLRARQCPECGDPFLPSQFEFNHSAVAFCCPHCDQPYYGTGEKGHLVPAEFYCVQCSQQIAMDEMVLRPAEGVAEHDTQNPPVPWVTRKEGGFSAFFRTIGRALVGPTDLGRGIRGSDSTLGAWWFAIVAAVFVAFLTMLPFVLLMAVVPMAMGGGGTLGVLFMAGQAAFVLVFGLLATLLALVLWGAAAHVLLRITGKTHSTIGRTYQCICYSSGANIATAFPCIGWYFGWIWWVVSAVLILKDGQRVSGGRAALAGILPPVIGLGLIVGGYMALIAAMVAGMGQIAVTPPPPPMSVSADAATSTRNLNQTLLAVLPVRDVAHAAQLIPDGSASSVMFIVSTTNTRLIDAHFGMENGAGLREMEVLPVSEQSAAAREAADALPQNVFAHRLGDFVFTYHGIDIGTADGRLWLLIASPDPERNAEDSFGGSYFVGRRSGIVLPISETEFDNALAEQNRIRQRAALAALPHPRDVTHGSPAAEQAIAPSSDE